MAVITDVGTLKTEIASWLNRSDLTLNIPGFIQLAEDEMRRRLRVETVRADLSISAEATNLPAAALELRSVRLKGASRREYPPLEITTPDGLQYHRQRYGGITGIPKYVALVNQQLVVVPSPNATFTAEITYYADLTRLAAAADATTSTLLTNNADLYLYGSLLQAEPFLENDERLPLWKSKFDAAIEQLNEQRQRQEFGAGARPLVIRRVFG